MNQTVEPLVSVEADCTRLVAPGAGAVAEVATVAAEDWVVAGVRSAPVDWEAKDWVAVAKAAAGWAEGSVAEGWAAAAG